MLRSQEYSQPKLLCFFLGNTIDEVHDFDGSPIKEDYCVFGMKKCRLRQYLITLPEILRKTMFIIKISLLIVADDSFMHYIFLESVSM